MCPYLYINYNFAKHKTRHYCYLLASLYLVWQLFKVDALILAINAAMRQTELKLGMVSVYDYRLIVVPLWKSFTQVGIGYYGPFSSILTFLSDCILKAFGINISCLGTPEGSD